MSDKETKDSEETSCSECGGVHSDTSELKDKLYKGIIQVLQQENVAPLSHNRRAIALLLSEISLEFAFEAGQEEREEVESSTTSAIPALNVRVLDLRDAPDALQELMWHFNDKMPKA